MNPRVQSLSRSHKESFLASQRVASGAVTVRARSALGVPDCMAKTGRGDRGGGLLEVFFPLHDPRDGVEQGTVHLEGGRRDRRLEAEE